MVNPIAKKRFEDQRNTYIAEDRKLRELGEKRKTEEREREEFVKGLAEEMPMKMVTEPISSVTKPGEGELFEEIKDFAGIGDEKDEKWEQEFISGFKKNTNIPSVAGTKQGLSDSMAIRVGVDEEVINKIKAEAEPKIGKDIFTESVEKGIADTSAAITGGIDFIFGNFLKGFGWENNPISAVNEYYQGLKRRKDEDLAKAVEKTGKGKAAEYGATLISGTVAAIPNLIIAGMSGGASAVGQAGGKVVPALGKMIRNPAFLYSFETSLYPEYEYAVQNGASEAEATVMAPIAALLSAGIETAGGIETVPALMKDENTRRKIFREWFKIAVEEGNEEVLQGLSTELLQKVIFDHDKEIISFDENKNAVMNVPNLARDWTLGTAVGGVLGEAIAVGKLVINDGRITPGFVRADNYSETIDRINTLTGNGYIEIGKIKSNSILNKVGLNDGKLYMDISKINKAISDHGDLATKIIMKNIPYMLNDPIVVTESKYDNTICVFSESYYNSSPIMIGIVITIDRSGVKTVNKIRTIHARRDTSTNITEKNVLYLNTDKKRTHDWFQALNTDVLLRGTKYGFIKKLTRKGKIVNMENE